MAKFISIPGILFICLTSIAFSAISAPLAYVPNEKDGNVSVIDAESDKVIYTIPASGKFGNKIQAVAMHPSGEKLFVVIRDANAVAMVDLNKREELLRIQVGDEPEGISISPDGKMLAACLEEENAVSFVDLATFKLQQTIKTQGRNPEHCVFSPNGKWLLASNEESNNVDVIDTQKLQSVSLIKSSKHPRGIAFSPDSKFVYVANEAANLLEVIRTS